MSTHTTAGRLALLALVAWSATATAAVAQRYFTEGPGLALPDGTCLNPSGFENGGGVGLGGLSRQLLASVTGTLTDVDVGLQALHPGRPELQLAISYQPLGGLVIGPVKLAHGMGGVNLLVTFDSDTGTSCEALCTQSGNCSTGFGPLCHPLGSLDLFDGAPAPGIFTLDICDRFGGGGIGSLETWSITVSGAGRMLDVDGNGAVGPLTDGLLAQRYAFGFRGAVLIASAVGPGCQRCNAAMIEAYLAFLSDSASFF
jgi:hypothetical protein